MPAIQTVNIRRTLGSTGLRAGQTNRTPRIQTINMPPHQTCSAGLRAGQTNRTPPHAANTDRKHQTCSGLRAGQTNRTPPHAANTHLTAYLDKQTVNIRQGLPGSQQVRQTEHRHTPPIQTVNMTSDVVHRVQSRSDKQNTC